MIKTLRKLKWFLYLKYVKKVEHLGLSIFPEIRKNAKIIVKLAQVTWGGKNIIEGFAVVRAVRGSIIFHHNVRLKQFVEVSVTGGIIEIGSDCIIHDFSILQAGPGGIKIGSDVRIAPHAKIFAVNHNFKSLDKPFWQQGISSKGIRIGSNIWIGTGVIILDGIEIGDNVIIGAGSVVTKSIESNSLAAGNPAKIIRKIFYTCNKQIEKDEI